MHQNPLFLEDFNEAAKALVSALGGPKKVGAALRPELPIEQAGNWIRDCMNPDRREKFSPEQVLMLMRMGHQAGCHLLTAFMLEQTGYQAPQPIEPMDEMAELQRQFVASVEAQKALLARMERIPDMARTVVKMPPAN